MFRVPFEVIKQRAQANVHLRPTQILSSTLRTEVWVTTLGVFVYTVVMWDHVTPPL